MPSIPQNGRCYCRSQRPSRERELCSSADSPDRSKLLVRIPIHHESTKVTKVEIKEGISSSATRAPQLGVWHERRRLDRLDLYVQDYVQ